MTIEKHLYQIFIDSVCLRTTFRCKICQRMSFFAFFFFFFFQNSAHFAKFYFWNLKILGATSICARFYETWTCLANLKIIIKAVRVTQENNLVCKIPVCKTHLQVTFMKHFLKKLRTICSSPL